MTDKIKINFNLNGKDVELTVEPRRLLVSALREDLELTGTHIGCDTTNCGACAVIVDGNAIKSCTMLAVQAHGKNITTIEGLSKEGEMHPVQKAFVEKQGLQCGFCTPGMIITSCCMLADNKNPNDEQIKKMLGGNICRCTGYKGIVESIRYASELMEKEDD